MIVEFNLVSWQYGDIIKILRNIIIISLRKLCSVVSWVPSPCFPDCILLVFWLVDILACLPVQA